MPLGNDPTPLAELEAGFGVTASAGDLIEANAANRPREQLAAALKPTNDQLVEDLRDDLGKLESHLGHEVVDANVRGSGASAIIQYVYVGPRGSNEKSFVPYAEVYGDAKLKRRHRAQVAQSQSPEAAGAQAAEEVRQQALEDAQATVRKARAEAEEVAREAREKAEQIIREAHAKAEEQQQDAQDDAAKAAEKATEETRKAAESEEGEKRGDGAAGVSGTSSGRTGRSQGGKAGGKS